VIVGGLAAKVRILRLELPDGADATPRGRENDRDEEGHGKAARGPTVKI
jgi:hypothetical protein